MVEEPPGPCPLRREQTADVVEAAMRPARHRAEDVQIRIELLIQTSDCPLLVRSPLSVIASIRCARSDDSQGGARTCDDFAPRL
jgi:hypothetical protein